MLKALGMAVTDAHILFLIYDVLFPLIYVHSAKIKVKEERWEVGIGRKELKN